MSAHLAATQCLEGELLQEAAPQTISQTINVASQQTHDSFINE